MKKIYWDIETEGLPVDKIQPFMPDFDAPGNIKDPEKIRAAIEEKRSGWIEKAALRAMTGKIIAFTFAWNDDAPKMITGDEATIIRYAINELLEVPAQRAKAYGWNSSGFDQSFLVQRAAVHDIPAFMHFCFPSRGRHYWDNGFIDARAVWANNSPEMTGTSLAHVALMLGVGEKTGSGKDFAALLKSNPAEAEKYAVADITLLRGIVKRMGI